MSTQPTPDPPPAPPTPVDLERPATLAYRCLVVLLLAVIAWNLHGIRNSIRNPQATKETARDLPTGLKLESLSQGSGDRLSKDTPVLPVYVVNGMDYTRVEGHEGNASYVAPLKLRSEDPFGLRLDIPPSGLPVRIQTQPVQVKVVP